MNGTIRSGWALVLGLLSAASVDAQTPPGTAFTYQGQLKSAGAPASGPHDLRFRLYDAQVGGVQVGPMDCQDNVDVTEGLFTVVLDFGAELGGQELFLEIDVRADTGLDCAELAGFVTLVPRQPLAAAPDAPSVPEADVLDGLDTYPVALQRHKHAGEDIITGTIADARLSPNVGLLNNSQTWTGRNLFTNSDNVFADNGARLTAVNADLLDGLDSSVFLQSVPNPLSLSGSQAGGHIIQGSNSSATNGSVGVFGVSTGSAGDTSGGYFVSLSGSGQGVYAEAPNLGVYARARVTTGFNFGVIGQSDATGGRGVYGLATASSGSALGVFGESHSPSGRGVFGLASADSGANYGGYFQSASPSGCGGFFHNTVLGSDFDVELSGPNGAVNTPGFVYREYVAGTPSAAIPIAYGSVDAAGGILSGTGNFTVAHPVAGQYDMTVSGEIYSNAGFTVTITPVSNSPRIANVADAGAGFRVNMWNLSGTLVDNAFQFTIWRSDPN